MKGFVIKRIFWMIPTIFVLSLIVFFLSKSRNTDPIDQELGFQFSDRDDPAFIAEYERIYLDRNYHLPHFYFTIKPSYYPDQINAISNPDERNQVLLNLKKNNLEGKYSLADKWPKIEWHGTHNQYHQWVIQILKGDFGHSIIDGRPSKDKISKALVWTLSLLILNIFWVVLISFPLGLFISRRRDSYWDKVISSLSFMIYSMPVIWLATLAVVFFTTDEYGAWTHLFPGVGIWNTTSSDSTFYMVWSNLDKLVLPLIVILLPDVAYLTRMIRNAVIEESSKPYVVSLKAKGLSDQQIYRKHILKNSLTPSISLFSSAIPGAIAGTLVVEVVFNIPGMGRLLYNGIINADWNVVFPVVLLTSVLTMLFFILSDILIGILNPKIDFD